MEGQVSFEEVYLLSENNHPLDKAFELFRSYYKLNDWIEADRVANHMQAMAESLYNNQLVQAHVFPGLQLPLRRPLVFYIGYSYLAKSIVYQKQGRYDAAREYIDKYANLDGFVGQDQDGRQEAQRFKYFAKANSYAIDLLSGKLEVLDEYNDFIKSNEEELLPGLITILEAANLNKWNIDPLLDSYIPEELETFASYEDAGNRVYYIKLLHQLSIYNLNQQRYHDTINYIIDYLSIAAKMNVDREFFTTVAMYEAVRAFTSTEQQSMYENILKGVLSDEKNINSIVYSHNIS
ncbi:DNA-binding protein [Paenibacillus sp. URB8-2]|uniref:DNA-binding protein n=1 Tax=Paenibacillus sp. URB8-2 TaxID=2741301 RepID=UPI0015B7C3A1|nr:DNA-binding protein [Paenibacillus sp. URB8-2]BCG60900.1 hypothetical protein PUR_43250 [Paenibacillus sp. URB8-2]